MNDKASFVIKSFFYSAHFTFTIFTKKDTQIIRMFPPTSDIDKSSTYIALEQLYGAHNYTPLPVVLERGRGIHVWDVNNKPYFDFLSAYSAVNQGHCHPAIINTLIDQAQLLTLTSRAFYNNRLGPCEQFLAKLFEYDKVLLMNSGVEAAETAIKLTRKWAYKVKGIPNGEAVIVFASGNFWGRTLAAVSASTDPQSRNDYGPYLPGFTTVPYNDIKAVETLFVTNNNIAGIMLEPIQGEAGVIVPDENYLYLIRELCDRYNILLIIDEIQTGLGRTGKLLACDWSNIRPDILVLGKALSGGTLPVSAVLANDSIMLTIQSGEHGSTYGGNPLAAAVTQKAIQVLLDEQMIQNADEMGELFRNQMSILQTQTHLIQEIRGRGLLNALVINCDETSDLAHRICIALMNAGVLCKPTHGNKIRFAPPLVITRTQLLEACEIIKRVFLAFNNKHL